MPAHEDKKRRELAAVYCNSGMFLSEMAEAGERSNEEPPPDSSRQPTVASQPAYIAEPMAVPKAGIKGIPLAEDFKDLYFVLEGMFANLHIKATERGYAVFDGKTPVCAVSPDFSKVMQPRNTALTDSVALGMARVAAKLFKGKAVKLTGVKDDIELSRLWFAVRRCNLEITPLNEHQRNLFTKWQKQLSFEVAKLMQPQSVPSAPTKDMAFAPEDSKSTV